MIKKTLTLTAIAPPRWVISKQKFCFSGLRESSYQHMSNYFDQWPHLTFIRQRDGARVRASDAFADKDYILLYFAPIWHGATRAFTPILRRFYEAHHIDKRFEVLYIARGSPPEELDNAFLGAPVATTAEGKDTSRTGSQHGSYYALAAEDMEAVAVPLLYHFRVFTYPSLMVLDNRPEVVAALRQKRGSAVPFLSSRFSPLENPALQAEQMREMEEREAMLAATAPPPASTTSGERPSEEGTLAPSPSPEVTGTGSPILKDGRGRRKYTPRIAQAAHVPKQLCLTGVFMLEKGDPTGTHFPWTAMGEDMAAGRRTFLSLAIAAFAIVAYVLVKYVFPVLMANDRAKRAARQARLAERQQGGGAV